MTQTIFPALHYRDADAALAFLTAAFGATEKEVYRGDEGTIHHAELFVAGSLIMFGQADASGGAGGRAISLYVALPGADEVDAHFARSTAAGATVVREPQDMEYGSREYGVADSEGNVWSFGSYDPFAAT